MMLRRGCVAGLAFESTVAHAIRSRVTGVRDQQMLGAGEEDARERRRHAAQRWIALGVGAKVPVRLEDAFTQRLGRPGRDTTCDQPVHQRRGGEIAGRAAAHSVGRTPARRESRILIEIPVGADVGCGSREEAMSHAQRAKYPR